MAQENDIKRVNQLLAWWINQIQTHNYVDFYDINQIAENLAGNKQEVKDYVQRFSTKVEASNK